MIYILPCIAFIVFVCAVALADKYMFGNGMRASKSAEQLLEDWWNEDPEMRHVALLCGNEYRFCVRLYQFNIDDPDYVDRLVGEHEAGTLLEAVKGALADYARNGVDKHKKVSK